MTKFPGYERQAQLLRVLSHPVRLEILHLLAQQEACVCHLETVLERPQPYVSQQLATLRRADLLVDRREGSLVYYRIADEHIGHWLEKGRSLLSEDGGEGALFRFQPGEKLVQCPCPKCQS